MDGRRHHLSRAAAALACLALLGCSTVDAATQATFGAPPLCAPGVAFGDVIAVPLTHWRTDQKERSVREAIAVRAIESALSATPCARSVQVVGIAPDSEVAARLEEAKRQGAQTALLVTVRELGPLLILSLPVLFSTWSDVQIDVEAIDLANDRSVLRLTHHRKVGGPFVVRGVAALQGELEIALRELIAGPSVVTRN